MRKPVLFRVTNNLGIGGVQRRLRSLLPLLTSDFEVHIVTYKDRGIFFDELSALGVHTHFLPRKGHWNPIDIGKLARLFRLHGAQIVHTHSFGGNISGILAASLARVPVRVAQVHLCDQHWYGATIARRTKQILEETLLHRLLTDRILFVSQESRDYFRRHTRLPDDRLTVLHNGLDLPDATPPASRAELGLPDGPRLIGFVGRVTSGKGLDLFLEIARQAARQSPHAYHFLVVGTGGDLPRHQQWAREHALDDHVTFLGERRDIHRCYAALDCLLFCSEHGVEGMPGVMLEACAHGLPILARRATPVEEIRAYYDRILFWNPERPATAQLDAAMALPEADQTRLRAEFSIAAMRDRTMALYRELLTAKRSRTCAC